MNDASPASATRPGLAGSLARLAESALALVRTRAELAALEFAESRDRARASLVLGAVMGLALAFAWLALNALVVVALWDTYRQAALGGIAVFHLLVALGAWLRLRAAHSDRPEPFAQTLAELDRDRQWLSEQLKDRS